MAHGRYQNYSASVMIHRALVRLSFAILHECQCIHFPVMVRDQDSSTLTSSSITFSCCNSPQPQGIAALILSLQILHSRYRIPHDHSTHVLIRYNPGSPGLLPWANGPSLYNAASASSI